MSTRRGTTVRGAALLGLTTMAGVLLAAPASAQVLPLPLPVLSPAPQPQPAPPPTLVPGVVTSALPRPLQPAVTAVERAVADVVAPVVGQVAPNAPSPRPTAVPTNRPVAPPAPAPRATASGAPATAAPAPGATGDLDTAVAPAFDAGSGTTRGPGLAVTGPVAEPAPVVALPLGLSRRAPLPDLVNSYDGGVPSSPALPSLVVGLALTAAAAAAGAQVAAVRERRSAS